MLGVHHPLTGDLPAGRIEVGSRAGALLIDGRPCATSTLVLAQGPAAVRFRLTPDGSSTTRSFAGQPVLRVAANGIEVGESVPMETYLLGVVGAEMPARWPAAALAAQAVAARSYACDRYLRRHRQPWQLDWNHRTDMQYHGVPTPAQPAVVTAVTATTGRILVQAGLPLPALFHASSGGRTTGAWPGLNLVDGRTPAALVGVDDPASPRATAALKWPAHQDWTARIPVDRLTKAAEAVSTASTSKPAERKSGDNRSRKKGLRSTRTICLAGLLTPGSSQLVKARFR
jgi:SpoIID/LytB domain protein